MLALAFLILAYLASRTWNLGALPPFIDELIHIQFAKAARDGDWRAGLHLWKWLSLQIYGLFLHATSDWPWVRMLNVLAGLGICLATFAIGSVAGGSRLGFWAALTYTVLPFAVFYDRLVLLDSMVALCLALILLCSFRLSHAWSRSGAVALGALLAFAPMLKASGFAFACVPLIVFLLMPGIGPIRSRLVRLFIPYVIFIPAALWLRFVMLPPEPAGLSLGGWGRGFRTVGEQTLETFWVMLTPPVALAIVLAGLTLLLWPNEQRRRIAIYFLLAGVIVSPSLLLLSKCYPRYYVPALVPLALIFGEGIEAAASRIGALVKANMHTWAAIFLTAIILIEPAVTSRNLVRDPLSVHLPQPIATQYVTGWGSGYGLAGVVRALRATGESSAGGPVLVLRSPRWDLTLQGLDVFREELGEQIELGVLRPWTPAAVVDQIKHRLQDGRRVVLALNMATGYPHDQAVREILPRAFAVEELWYRPKPGGTPGLRLIEVRPK